MDKASGALPEDHPLYAPGLKWRARSGGAVPYWIAPAKDIREGYVPKNLILTRYATPEEIARACREQWENLKRWRVRNRKDEPEKYTVAWLIHRYLTDEASPFRKVQSDTQANYRLDCDAIYKLLRKVPLLPVKDGGHWRPQILGHDIIKWHAKFAEPAEPGGAPRQSRARHIMSMLRGLFTYAVVLGVPGARDQREVLSVVELPAPPARATAPNLAQVDKLVKAAEQQGYRSIAIATLAQYELIERRVHIIGRWDGDAWKPGWVWEGVTPDWRISYTQRKRNVVLREFDLKATQRLLGLMQQTPKESRTGPVIVCEDTGLPWRRRAYAERFREIAREAGLPDSLWSMDMRAGGATEADGIEGVTDRALQDGGGWADPKIMSRYRRSKQRNAQNVVELRQRNRRHNDG